MLADIVIRAKFVSRWHTTDRCKLQTQEPLVCELPRNDRVGLPELPPCVFDKEDAAALGLVIHLWNPLSVNVSRFDWAEAFPLFRSRKKPQSRVHFTACLSLLAVDTKQKCRVPQSGFRVIPPAALVRRWLSCVNRSRDNNGSSCSTSPCVDS